MRDKKEIAKFLDFDIQIKDGGIINLKGLTSKVTEITIPSKEVDENV